MRSCIVLGSARSGAGLVAGALAPLQPADAGPVALNRGGSELPPRLSRPRGSHQAMQIAAVNEALLGPATPARPFLREGERWLAVPRADARTQPTARLCEAMATALEPRPFCLADTRFAFTLGAWEPLLGDAAVVCAFRHPAASAAGMLEVCRSSGARPIAIDLDHAFAHWIASYRELLARHRERAPARDWLFVHADQMLDASGRERLAGFLDAELDADAVDPTLRRRPPADLEVPAEALQLYDELCRLAAYDRAVEERARDGRIEPAVAVLAIVGDSERAHVAAIASDVRVQRGVRARLYLVDATAAGDLDHPGATCLRIASPSRGERILQALQAISEPFVALHLPGCRMLPNRLARAVAALEERGADLATCDAWLTGARGAFTGRTHLAAMGEAPPPFWESGIVARRAALETLRATAFHPVELELLQRLRAGGRAVHDDEPGFAVEQSRHEAAWDRSRQDAALVALARRPFTGERPEVSVSLCTYDRRAVVTECLEALCRQLLPPGTFEVVFVDDGSTDGTTESLSRLELPIPVRFLRQENAGLPTARNTGLAAMHGDLVLFVNDDTIAFPDLVERHLRRHAHQGPGERVAVLGHFEQPTAALDDALMRYLEGSTEVFGYAAMKPGELYDGFHSYTANVSVPLAAVREVGGFDPRFVPYGCDDTDLGVRLAARGWRYLYDADARAMHRHVLDLAALARRQRTVASSYVLLARKHPQVLEQWHNHTLTARDCRDRLRELSARRALLEEAAGELARMDVGSLERLEGPFAEIADEVVERLGGLVRELDRIWWLEGYLDGMRQHGLAGFDELVADGTEPWPIAAEAPRRVLAWPDWSRRESLERLLDLAAELLPAAAGDAPFAALLLRLDPERDPPRAEALARLEQVWNERMGADATLEVLLEEVPLTRAQVRRLGCTVDALLACGDELRDFLAEVAAEPLATPEAVRGWRRRFEGAPGIEAGERPRLDVASHLEAREPELSVIVPTHDRPRELRQLLGALALQDLEPWRFEVVVVDDGSDPPVDPKLADAPWPFRLELLRQEAAGPAAARNRGLERARGELVVLFNDDAVPARDNLRRHAEAWRAADRPRAVLGGFDLLPELVDNSFAHYVTTSSGLFAQPLMKPGVLYPGLSFCTGNVSLPRAELEAVGGFDAGFPHAGGEDSELGLRLERECGLRVHFDPAVRCGHDHAMDPRAFARRRRLVGWSAWRIESLHGDCGLVAGPDVPGATADDGFWIALADEVQRDREACESLLDEVAVICEREVAQRTGPLHAEDVRPALEAISRFEYRRGLLLGHLGLDPAEEVGELPVAPRAGSTPVTPMTRSRSA